MVGFETTLTTDDAMIRIERFEKSYGKVHAVKPLDLEVSRGESFALLGPNGSGKTSIIRAVVGLHAPTGGRILVGGFDVAREPDRVKRQLVYVPQRVTMPDLLTVREVLLVFSRLNEVSSDRIDETLALMALEEVIDRPAHELSGGMLQRLGLAVAFLREAPLLVLDEPTLNLDPLGIERLQQHLSELKQKQTSILFSSHRLHTAMQLADRVGVLVDGRMASIEAVSTFKTAVTLHTTVRMVFSHAVDTEKTTCAATGAGAEVLECSQNEIRFNALPERRLEIIRAIERSGGEVEEFHTEAPDWEALIREHFGNQVKEDR